jgi:hypothetical protein
MDCRVAHKYDDEEGALMGAPEVLGYPTGDIPNHPLPGRQSLMISRLAFAHLATIIAFAATFLIRAVNLATSWDIHVDEITYLRLSQGLAEHAHLRLYGAPFFLHPPGFFAIEAMALKLSAPEGYVIQQVYAVRWLGVLLAAASAALLLIIGRRIAGAGAGIAAAGIFALEPFTVRTNSRNMLETPALFWVLLGYTALLMPAGARPPRWRVLATGGAFGMALLTKDMTAFLTLLPLALCFLFSWALPRRDALLAGVVAIGCYALYPLLAFATGDFGYFAEQKLHGLLRLAGIVKVTGYKRVGGPSFLESIVANIDQFMTTYAILSLGVLAVVVLSIYGGREHRLLLAWAASAYALLGYCIAFGTLEEQFFYFLIIPSILAIVTGGALLAEFAVARSSEGRWYRGGMAALGLAFCVWSGDVWFSTHTTPDNGYERVRAHLLQHAPPGTRVAATTEPAVFLLDGFASGSWGAPRELADNRVEYVIVSTKEMAQGLGYASPDLGPWLTANAEPVFAFTGRSNGTLLIYRLPVGQVASAGHETGSPLPNIGEQFRNP